MKGYAPSALKSVLSVNFLILAIFVRQAMVSMEMIVSLVQNKNAESVHLTIKYVICVIKV